MKDDIRPILVCPAVPYNGGIRFLTPKEQLDINEKYAPLIWQIISISNGYNSIEDIEQKCDGKTEIIHDIICDLIDIRVMMDSRALYQHFHDISSSPDYYYRNLDLNDILEFTKSERKPLKKGKQINFDLLESKGISNLIASRKTCRSFSSEELSKETIGNICYNAYSLKNHAVPSGGALYPLKLYVLVEKDQGDLPMGYYEYDAERNVLIRYREEIDYDMLKYCFNDEDMPYGSSVQLVIAADLSRQTYKYSNRGYRLTLIEVGHVAQNICLFCTENGVETCELGGVFEKSLSEELGILDRDISPILTIAIGKGTDKKRIDYIGEKYRLEKEYVGETKCIKEYGINKLDEDVAFWGAYSIYGENNAVAGATASSYYLAVTKAIIEGVERNICRMIRTDYYGPAKDIKGRWLNPNTIRPLTSEQRKQDNLAEFNELLSISWTKGVVLNSGDEILVPSDLIYYGFERQNNSICFSDSSGVAAYYDFHKAVEKAIMELVERDALMRNWYERIPPNKIEHAILPLHIRKRIEYWKKKNREVFVLDMESPFAPTIQVIIVSKEYPCFVSGAASNDKVEKAICKAFQEAEYDLCIKLKRNNDDRIIPSKVLTPEDHGKLYSFPDYINNIKWLWSSNCYLRCLPSSKYSYNELLQIIDPIIVTLSANNDIIKVVRAISLNCLPISFGYNMDYYTHPIVKKLNFDSKSRLLPHYFA